MHYIVFDLEWNQSPRGKAGERAGLPFEIIEIERSAWMRTGISWTASANTSVPAFTASFIIKPRRSFIWIQGAGRGQKL